MDSRVDLKVKLRRAIAASNPDGTYAEDAFAQVHECIQALVPLTPLPRPIDDEAQVTGPWNTLFAQFGPRHTAGKPLAHESRFDFLTFKKFPSEPLRVLKIEQEVDHVSKSYSNVHFVESLDGAVAALLIVFGHYEILPAEPQRYQVAFDRAELRARNAITPAELRAAFGFGAEQPLSVEFKPPRLHSDVVYCDADLRINYGSMGGVYVLERVHHAGNSVSFT
jgi:hypothetical protein